MPQIIPFPADQELEWRVKQLVAENCGSDVEELDAGYTLRSDLHLDGDDAVRFFEQYGSEFGTDLTELWASWSFYFRPQNLWLSGTMKLALAVAGSAGLLEWILFPHFSPLVAFVTVGGLFVVILLSVEIAGRINRGPEKPEMREITIGELILAARSGKWNVPKEIQDWVAKQEYSRRLS
jgi:hypothetical protein